MTILNQLTELAREKKESIEQWCDAHKTSLRLPITTSVDLRHAGFKIAPVDTNLFPAGFHNVSKNAHARAAEQLKNRVTAALPEAKKILIIPENHTRNLPYLDNVLALKSIAETAGFEVQIGNLATADPIELTTASNRHILQQPLKKEGDRLVTKSGFDADFMLLNNDCTTGWPELLKDIAQPICPSPKFGWHARRKTEHFKHYQALATEFSELVGLDPWLISAYWAHVGGVRFKSSDGVDRLAQEADDMLANIQSKYDQYGINQDPYIYVKADSGTYGMGIMTARSGAELLELNKKARNKMHVVKEGAEVSDVIMQEGVPTVDVIEGKPAEPMVYMVAGEAIGGMFRVNGNRDSLGNLNATGMEYHGMCDEGEQTSTHHAVRGCDYLAYRTIANLALLAAAKEMG